MLTSSRRLPWAVVLLGLTLIALTTACTSLSGGGGSAEITMVNQSGQTICYVNISPVTEQYWGDDWLGSSETVENGQSRTFEVEPGDWDLRALTCDQDTIEEERQVSIASSGYQWIVGP